MTTLANFKQKEENGDIATEDPMQGVEAKLLQDTYSRMFRNDLRLPKLWLHKLLLLLLNCSKHFEVFQAVFYKKSA